MVERIEALASQLTIDMMLPPMFIRHTLLLITMMLGAMTAARAAIVELSPRAPADTVDSARLDNRWRVQAGGAAFLQRGLGPQYFPTVNIDYRWTGIVRPGSEFAIGPVAELGVNILVPYGKGGLEVRVGDFFLDAHMGMTVGLFVGAESAGLGPVVFTGSCGGYMFTLGRTRLELETGFNVADINGARAIAYATTAIAW
jgi:hypothetical protein